MAAEPTRRAMAAAGHATPATPDPKPLRRSHRLLAHLSASLSTLNGASSHDSLDRLGDHANRSMAASTPSIPTAPADCDPSGDTDAPREDGWAATLRRATSTRSIRSAAATQSAYRLRTESPGIVDRDDHDDAEAPAADVDGSAPSGTAASTPAIAAIKRRAHRLSLPVPISASLAADVRRAVARKSRALNTQLGGEIRRRDRDPGIWAPGSGFAASLQALQVPSSTLLGSADTLHTSGDADRLGGEDDHSHHDGHNDDDDDDDVASPSAWSPASRRRSNVEWSAAPSTDASAPASPQNAHNRSLAHLIKSVSTKVRKSTSLASSMSALNEFTASSSDALAFSLGRPRRAVPTHRASVSSTAAPALLTSPPPPLHIVIKPSGSVVYTGIHPAEADALAAAAATAAAAAPAAQTGRDAGAGRHPAIPTSASVGGLAALAAHARIDRANAAIDYGSLGDLTLRRTQVAAGHRARLLAQADSRPRSQSDPLQPPPRGDVDAGTAGAAATGTAAVVTRAVDATTSPIAPDVPHSVLRRMHMRPRAPAGPRIDALIAAAESASLHERARRAKRQQARQRHARRMQQQLADAGRGHEMAPAVVVPNPLLPVADGAAPLTAARPPALPSATGSAGLTPAAATAPNAAAAFALDMYELASYQAVARSHFAAARRARRAARKRLSTTSTGGACGTGSGNGTDGADLARPPSDPSLCAWSPAVVAACWGNGLPITPLDPASSLASPTPSPPPPPPREPSRRQRAVSMQLSDLLTWRAWSPWPLSSWLDPVREGPQQERPEAASARHTRATAGRAAARTTAHVAVRQAQWWRSAAHEESTARLPLPDLVRALFSATDLRYSQTRLLPPSDASPASASSSTASSRSRSRRGSQLLPWLAGRSAAAAAAAAAPSAVAAAAASGAPESYEMRLCGPPPPPEMLWLGEGGVAGESEAFGPSAWAPRDGDGDGDGTGVPFPAFDWNRLPEPLGPQHRRFHTASESRHTDWAAVAASAPWALDYVPSASRLPLDAI
ncbi:hypothetical protein CXG81DRAFT_17946 [Caulochytrium protostelioides]|uniref:Uncharacterized protein n=1 Tax=Caulochytrium protostelioides TaxID=1555241 RepID=A0A4P9XAL2_9FUNG|nr:hypothetical protein CXG81DRAFT_17946 [Caulochytrium protostelioides]|eukprot:RKP02423.1 hypothetical protein CXG81DRAFT_17946 [Caulochytrium protostelioides]